MARARARTLLPLDRWAEIIGINPRHFNQVTTVARPMTTCDIPWRQHAWQFQQQIGREDVAVAIQNAENTIARYAKFRLLPTWEVDERHVTHAPGISELFNANGVNARGLRQNIEATWGHFVSGGVEAKTLIAANAPVTYTDDDRDDYKETATITVTTAITDAEDIAVYFPSQSGSDAWEVRPIRSVTFANGVAEIKVWKHQLVDPVLWEALDPSNVNGDEDGNFLTAVDVYRHFNDPQTQAQLWWQPVPDNCNCGTGTCNACELSSQSACLTSVNNRSGRVSYSPATWNAATGVFDRAAYSVGRNPERVRMWYYAGNRDERQDWPRHQMDPELERSIVYLSLQYLDRPICQCTNIQGTVQWWREDMAFNFSNTAGAQSYNFGANSAILSNPFGSTRGGIFAWRAINQDGIVVGRAAKV